MSLLILAIVTMLVLYALRNIFAIPVELVMRLFGVQDAMGKSRALVGGTGEFVCICICMLGLYIFWHIGVLQVIGEAFGNIFSDFFGFLKLLPAAVMELLA